MRNGSPADRHSLLARWGGVTARHPWRIALVWLVITIAAAAVALGGLGTNQSLFDRLTSGVPSVPGESQTAWDLIDEHEREQAGVLLMVEGVDLTSPEVAQAAAGTAAEVMGIDGVTSAANPYVFPDGPNDPRARGLIADGALDSGGFIMVTRFDSSLDEQHLTTAQSSVRSAYEDLGRTLPGDPEVSTSIGGRTLLVDEILNQVQEDFRTGEGIALPLSFILMVFVFGGFIAAGMPILGAVASIVGGLAALYGFTYAFDLDASVVNVVTLFGLALSIDYGLLIVSRAREELRVVARGRPAAGLTDTEIETAISRTVATAGRTVFFSGITVAISLAGLMVFNASYMRAVGAAGMSVVLIAMLAGISLVPAMCAVAANRLLAKSTQTASDHGLFSKLAGWVHRMPWLVFPVTVGVLIVFALPTLSMQLTNSRYELLPVGSSQRDFFDALEAHYPQLGIAEATIVVEASPDQAAAYAKNDIEPLTGVATVSVDELGDGFSVVSVRTDEGSLSPVTNDLVETLRAQDPGFETWVAGQSADLADFTEELKAKAPLAIASVVSATFLLLFLMTGSVVIPIKALILNVLSLGASLGITTWIFQNGHLSELLGFTSTGAVESMIPPLVFALGFGLSMDYELFLISRIAEVYRSGVSSKRAVELGLQRSGRIITSAALLIVIVFAGFVAGKMLSIKQTGTALMIAILLDASIVRMLLVPATMELLGDRNWWAPAPLRRWHARHGLSE
ncbi:MAG: multidrug RND transporter [Actinomycetales bacterium]|nr:MAG: multidrug RND transporter [Actinomycetales bacterium]